MKSLKLLPLLILMSLFVNAQTSTPTSVVDTSVTFSKVYNDVKSGIAGLAVGLKVTATHVYTVLVRQQLVNSISYLIVLLLSVFLLINFTLAAKSTEKWSKDDGDPIPLFFVRLIQGVLSLVALCIAGSNLDVILTGLVNPEYGAIQDIINFVK